MICVYTVTCSPTPGSRLEWRVKARSAFDAVSKAVTEYFPFPSHVDAGEYTIHCESERALYSGTWQVKFERKQNPRALTCKAVYWHVTSARETKRRFD